MSNVISVTDVSWRRDNRYILRDVDWCVKQGEHWAIVGVNGSGKTSLLNIINGYNWPTSGQIEVLGERFGQTNLQELRRRIGWVSSSLLERIERSEASHTTLQIVMSGKYASVGMWKEASTEDEHAAMRLLEAFGVETLAGSPYASLSQGQKQRVVIARAWMANPELLILDEPCTGLDVPSRETLLRAVSDLGAQASSPTLIYVTHHVEEILPVINKCIVLKNGSVLASGDKEEILSDAVLSDAFDVAVSVTWDGSRPWIRVVDNVTAQS